MLSIVEVKCPHCGAEGRIMLPPMGSIILGPCPECSEMVVVFCGRVLPLDKEIVTEGSTEQRKAHLLQVLTHFLRERIDLLVKDSDPNTLTGDDLGTGEVDELMAEAQAEDVERSENASGFEAPEPMDRAISEEELKSFVKVDLANLDDREYFRAIFQPGDERNE